MDRKNDGDFTNFSSALLDTLWLAGHINTGIMMNIFKIKLEQTVFLKALV